MRLLICSEKLPATPQEWVKVATVGEWAGYGKKGAKLTADDLAAAVEFFAETGSPNGGADGLIDYEHDTIRLAKGELTGKQADAAGWFTEIETRENGRELWMRASWTPAAQEKIAAREKRYVSPSLLFGRKHPVTGKAIRCALDSVALTNTPFFKHLPAVAASDLAAAFAAEPRHTPPSAFQGFAVDLLVSKAEPMGDGPCYETGELACSVHAADDFGEVRRHELVGGLTILLGRYEGTDRWDTCGFRFDAARWPHARAREWLDEHHFTGELTATAQEDSTVDRKALIAKLGLAEGATDEQIMAKLGELLAASDAVPAAVIAAIGLDEDADADAVVASIGELKAKAEAEPQPDHRVLVATTALGIDADADAPAIVAAIEGIKGKVVTDEAEALIASAVKAGKVAPADRERWLAFARADLANCTAVIGSLTPILGPATGGTPPPGDSDPELTDEEKRIGSLFGCDTKDLIAVKKGRALVGA